MTGSADTNSLIRATDVHVSYGKLRVLRGVSVVVRHGESVALLGTNGAGKSTLLKAVTGILPIDEGSVTIDGVDMTGADPRQLLARGIVHLPGGRGTFPNLTVDETLRVGLWTRRRDRKTVAAACERVFDTFPILANRRTQLAGTLSGGEQQMLLLSRGLMLDPRLLIIDELSLGLAPVVTSQLLDIIGAVRSRGTALLLVDQRLATAAAITDRAYFLERGTIRFSGPTAELHDRGDLVRSVFLSGADR